MSESWDDFAEEWDTNEDAIAYSEKVFETLVKEINLEGLNVLDFGCGTGLLTEKMSRLANKIVALDSSGKMVSILNNKKLVNVTTIAEALTDNTIKANSSLDKNFNLIVASSVFGFLPEYESTLALLRSLLIPGGLLIQWDWQSSKEDEEFGLSQERIRLAYRESGLVLKSITTPFSHLSPKGSTPVLMGVAEKS